MRTQPHLVVDRVIGDAETIAQDIGDESAHRSVARPPSEGGDDFGKVLLTPSAFHAYDHLPSRLLHQGFLVPVGRLQNWV